MNHYLEIFYVRRTDKWSFELWNTQIINVIFEQLRDYLVDIEEINNDELIMIINDLIIVLGVDVNDSFRNFFIEFMDIYADGDDNETVKNKIEAVNNLMNIYM